LHARSDPTALHHSKGDECSLKHSGNTYLAETHARIDFASLPSLLVILQLSMSCVLMYVNKASCEDRCYKAKSGAIPETSLQLMQGIHGNGQAAILASSCGKAQQHL